MKKGMSFQLIVIVMAFLIVLIVSLFFLTIGKDYLYKLGDEFVNLLGGK